MSGGYRFNCPSCGESVVVDESIHDSILDDGCLICQGSATEDDFLVLDGQESTP